MAQKWHRLSQQGLDLQPLPVPQTPLAGWRVLNQQSIPVLHERIPIISNGNMYQYLSCGEKQSTMFHALYRDTNKHRHKIHLCTVLPVKFHNNNALYIDHLIINSITLL